MEQDKVDELLSLAKQESACITTRAMLLVIAAQSDEEDDTDAHAAVRMVGSLIDSLRGQITDL